ncbi:type IV pilus modification PilV family protein [Elongatibacter sediminis]|uniref:Prepilin-type N-terminal cleavage/methylation domain-containing protein n=1 Tax=Elongatibacter sediminis TaxID=3119006 RepID=A0AAW9RNB7_9GAMM
MLRTIRQRSLPTGRAGGFTLLEVLLAFVVFAMSFAVVLQILSGSMRNTVRAREYTEAALIAQSVMDQVGLGIPLEAGAGMEGEEGPYRWEVGVFEFGGMVDNPRTLEVSELTGVELLEVECEVSWGEFPRERSQMFNTVRAVLANRDGIRPGGA